MNRPTAEVTPEPPAGAPPAAVPTLPPPPLPPAGSSARGGAGAVVAAVLVALWVVGVTLVTQSAGWFIEQYRLLSGLPHPAWQWLTAAGVQAVLLAGPAALIAFVPRSLAVRAAGRAWLVAGLAGAALGVWRAVPPAHHELYLAGLALTAALLARILGRGDPAAHRGEVAPAAVLFAIAAGLAALLPWLWAGALGGLLETLLAGLAAAAVGRLAARLLSAGFWAPFERRRLLLVLVGGLVAGVALVALAAGVGAPGTQLAALLMLPPLGFVAAALRPIAHRGAPDSAILRPNRPPPPGSPTGWLIGVAAFGPLAFADPEEITLLLATGTDTLYWVAVATLGSLAIGLLLAIAYGLVLARPRAPMFRTAIAGAVALIVAVAGGAVYATAGRPGLYGERLFVVLRDQADLGAVTAGRQVGQAGRDARAREVYRRLVEHARRTQAGVRAELDRLHLSYTPYYLVNGVEVAGGGPAVRALLSRRGDVDRVLVDQRLRPLPQNPKPASGNQPAPTAPPWNLTMLRAPLAWSAGATGAGIVVGSSDSGVDGRHPALAPGFRGGDDSWYDPWNHTREPVDANGHGTHTLASAVGRTNVGVAPDARWIGCVNLARNMGNPARYLDCLQFMLAPFPPGGDPFTAGRPERAPHVLSNSWGCPPIEGCDMASLRPAVHAIAAAGIFFVAAAGNTGPYCASIDEPPAMYPDAFTVGGVNQERRVADFSSRGPVPGGGKPDVVAPGAGILSALPGDSAAGNERDRQPGYGMLSGTSMAAPQVAGVVALLWSKNPALIGDLARTRELIVRSAQPAEPSYLSRKPADACDRPANVTGAGIPDAYAAVRAAAGVD